MSYNVIRASEIGEYIFCNRSWWLRRTAGQQATEIERLAAGTSYHWGHESGVRKATWARRVALVLLFLAMSTLAFWLVSVL